MAVLDERHHTFLQALMRRGPLSEQESKAMFQELFGASQDFFEFLTTVNRELDYLSMEVRGSTDQYSGKLFYGLVNKLANEEAKLGTRLTHPQLAFFKAILVSIMSDSSASGCLSSVQALNLRLDTQTDTQTQATASTSQAVTPKLTMAAKEETLATLVEDNWLGRTEDGMIRLGTKSFLELRSLFKNFDVPFCEVCNEAAIKAQLCSNDECNVRMHSYCAPRKFARRQVPKVCPGCRTPWRMVTTDGEAANVSEEDEEEEEEEEDARAPTPAPARGARARPSQRRARAKLEKSSDDENGNNANDDDDDDEETVSAPPLQRSSQGRKVVHTRAKMKSRR